MVLAGESLAMGSFLVGVEVLAGDLRSFLALLETTTISTGEGAIM